MLRWPCELGDRKVAGSITSRLITIDENHSTSYCRYYFIASLAKMHLIPGFLDDIFETIFLRFFWWKYRSYEASSLTIAVREVSPLDYNYIPFTHRSC